MNIYPNITLYYIYNLCLESPLLPYRTYRRIITGFQNISELSKEPKKWVFRRVFFRTKISEHFSEPLSEPFSEIYG